MAAEPLLLANGNFAPLLLIEELYADPHPQTRSMDLRRERASRGD
jgi:hypothetical protein